MHLMALLYCHFVVSTFQPPSFLEMYSSSHFQGNNSPLARYISYILIYFGTKGTPFAIDVLTLQFASNDGSQVLS